MVSKRKTYNLSASTGASVKKDTSNVTRRKAETINFSHTKPMSVYNELAFEQTLASVSLQEEKDIDRLVSRKERYLKLMRKDTL